METKIVPTDDTYALTDSHGTPLMTGLTLEEAMQIALAVNVDRRKTYNK